MNRLQLVQDLIVECGASGSLSTTLNQTGDLARYVGYIDKAWERLQTRRDDWEFMRSSNILGQGMSFTTVEGQSNYPLGTGAGTCGVTAATFGKWVRDSFRIYTTSVGVSSEIPLGQIPYDAWRDGYMIGANRSVRTMPVAVAIGPAKQICLGPPPLALYTVTGDYYMAPTAMTADADTPTGLPAQFHMMLVYKAMEYYGAYETAPEVSTRGAMSFRQMFSELTVNYAPEVTTAGPLA